MISNRVERRKPYATEEEVLVTRIDSVRHAAEQTKDSVRHAAEVVSPYASTAKENAAVYADKARATARTQYDAHLASRVGEAVGQARAAVPPKVEQAVGTAAKRTKQAADFTIPKVEQALESARAATGPAREEIVARSGAALAALRSQLTAADIEKFARKRARRVRAGRIAKRLTVLGALSGAGFAGWRWWTKQTNPDWLVEPAPATELSDRSSLNGSAQSGTAPLDQVDGAPLDALDPEVQAKQAEAEAERGREGRGDTYP
jgi:hypothetical protein